MPQPAPQHERARSAPQPPFLVRQPGGVGPSAAGGPSAGVPALPASRIGPTPIYYSKGKNTLIQYIARCTGRTDHTLAWAVVVCLAPAPVGLARRYRGLLCHAASMRKCHACCTCCSTLPLQSLLGPGRGGPPRVCPIWGRRGVTWSCSASLPAFGGAMPVALAAPPLPLRYQYCCQLSLQTPFGHRQGGINCSRTSPSTPPW